MARRMPRSRSVLAAAVALCLPWMAASSRPDLVVKHAWLTLHASEVPSELFVALSKRVYGNILWLMDSAKEHTVGEFREGFKGYARALAVVAAAMKPGGGNLDKHGFGYAYLLTPEYYFPDTGPSDSLYLVSQDRPNDAFQSLRSELDAHWAATPKVGGRVRFERFEAHFVDHYHEQLQGAEAEAEFRGYLRKVFDAGLAMMRPKATDSLPGHCFRYVALLVGEFSFPSKDGTRAGPANQLSLEMQ
mmetsp:Transcript_68/g.225  ORF Transcript_68/g.225 Transcript_68/m.225 type:complete len:246 (-) Transcript_68:31-768(-)